MLPLSYLLSLLFVALAAAWKFFKSPSLAEVPMESSYLPFFGSAFGFAAAPAAFLRRCQERWGNVFKVLLAGRTIVFFTAPEHVALVLKTKALSFHPIVQEICVTAFGHEPEFAVPTNWHYREVHALFTRHLVNSGGLDPLVQSTSVHQQAFLRPHVEAGGRRPLFSFVRQGLFEANSRALFGVAFCDRYAELLDNYIAFDESFPILASGIAHHPMLTPLTLTVVLAYRGLAAGEAIAQSFCDAIENPSLMDGCSQLLRDRNKSAADAPLQLFQEMAKETAARNMAGTQLALVWAANSNSVPTAFWTIYHLLAHPAAWAAVVAEVQACLPKHDFDACSSWSKDALDQCVLLGSAIDEALRLGSSSLILRQAVADVSVIVDKRPVPLARGERIAMFPALQHMNAALFDAPEAFRFDRFVHATKSQRDALRPFGLGSTLCPGRFLAKYQIKSWIALMIQLMPNVRLVPGGAPAAFDKGRVGLGVYPPMADDAFIEFDALATSA
uniref:Secreted protein n=1 Tax=Achlya hypogyna TaxID=1202772 RepID=A0A0A7CNL9_ACHHY|nr:secreted protein [Achlya hypogyna]